MSKKVILTVNVIVDNDSWILKYAHQFASWCISENHNVVFCRTHDQIGQADISFFLGCVHIASEETLLKSKLNLVVHESDLPKGRGFAPMAWQILEGKSSITVSLIEAANGDVDSGAIFGQSKIELQGHELADEWRYLQGQETVKLCTNFIQNYPNYKVKDQVGMPTFFHRREPRDSVLDITKSIEDQFNLLRVVDNLRYPAFFNYRGHRYDLTIKKHDPLENTPHYVFASIKPWQIKTFHELKDKLPGKWTLITEKDELSEDFIQQVQPRYIFFGHWSWFVPETILNTSECVCFHMTDVPFGRGGSPLQNLISRGITKTKISALRMVKELDAGPVYQKRDLSLYGTAQEIFERMTPVIFQMINEIIIEEPIPMPQEGIPVIFDRRTPEMSRLPDDGEIQALYNHIRMLDAETYPPAFIDHGNFRISFKNAKRYGEKMIKLETEIVIIKPEDSDE